MSGRARSWVLVVVQLVLVLSVAGKYLLERRTCPRVWVRATQVDPVQPLRGRYLALRMSVDTCGLPRDKGMWTPGYRDGVAKVGAGGWEWGATLAAKGGRLTAQVDGRPRSPSEMQQVVLVASDRCDRASLTSQAEYFVSDQARVPFPLKAGEELWVEVTVPPSGPPRPIQMATSDSAGFHMLPFR